MLDSCVLSTEDSTFLQQASHITNGVYLKPLRQEGLTQYLMSVFIIEKSLRTWIELPAQPVVDFKAVCFDTKEQTDLAYVCSVCLSSKSHDILLTITVFSKYDHICATCGVKYEILRK
jgi:transcription initiation factor TFIIH subunit 3